MASPTTSTVLLTEGWAPQTDAERDSVLRQLQRILNSSAFRNSKRYPALLKFIVEQTLDGRGDALKERVLGVEVFGKPFDYDTGSDHIVRTAAGEVRKRLAQYYLNDGGDDEIRIDVPPGSYVAQFRLMDVPALVPIVSPALTLPAEPEAAAEPKKWWRTRWVLAGSVAANVLLVAALAYYLVPWAPGSSALRQFWEPVFESNEPVLVSIGLRDETRASTPAQAAAGLAPTTAAAGTSQDPLRRRVSMADLLALSRVTSYAGERHARYRILDSLSTSFTDLRNEPTVLIGVGNNTWTKRLEAQMRYGFVLNEAGNPYAIHDSQQPQRPDWVRGDLNGGNESFRDYAIVSRLLDPRVEQVVVVLGGLGPHGTEVAGEFVTTPDQIRKLEAFAPSGWSHRNLQVVLSTEVVKGSSGPPKIEAAYFW